MNLFESGEFTLSSGAKSAWKIECDALTDEDVKTLALMISQMVGPFGSVEGVPRGGLRLAEALDGYRDRTLSFVPLPHLIVDDVLTTGGSMNRLKERRASFPDGYVTSSGATIIGAVIFARGPRPAWIRALMQMPECFWVKRPWQEP